MAASALLEMEEGTSGGTPGVRDLHLFVLSVFAFSQPIYDILARNAEFFVVRRAQPIDVVILLVVLSVGVPAVPVLLHRLARLLGDRFGRVTFVMLFGGLLTLIGLVAARSLLPLPGVATLAIALLFAALGIVAYRRFAAVGFLLTFLSAAVVVVPALFLANGTVWSTLFPSRSETRALAQAPAVPVVFLIFDGLSLNALLDSEGDLDRERFPGFAALASRSTWYPFATTTSDSTLHAVPAILTGRYPRSRTQPHLAHHPDNLFTLLGSRQGLHVVESHTQLCPEWMCGAPSEPLGARTRTLLSDVSIIAGHVLLPEGWTGWLPEITQRWMDFAGGSGGPLRPVRGRHFRAFVDDIDGGAEPELHYLHTNLPHSPYYFLPSGLAYRQSTREASAQGGQWGEWDPDDVWGPVQSQQKYLLQVAFADRLLGELLARLELEGLSQDVLLVVTADHGTSFRAGDARRRITPTNAQDIMRVPLFIQTPGQREEAVDFRPVENVDILPTVAAYLGRQIPWRVDGRNLGEAADERAEVRIHPVNGGVRSFESRSFKELDAGLADKARLFGEGDTALIFRAGPNPELLGRRLDDLEVRVDDDLQIALHHPARWDDVNTQAGFLPAEVTGTVRDSGWEATDSAVVAIAVNGVVAATTRSYPPNGVWSAIVPPETLSPGANRVEGLVVEDGPAGFTLRRSRDGEGATYLGLALGGRFVLGVEEDGFFPAPQRGGDGARWTGGRAMLRVPLRGDEHPTALQLDIREAVGPNPALKIDVNGCRIFEGRIGRGGWSRTIPLGACPVAGDEAHIELISTVYVDPRALPGTPGRMGRGVRVGSVKLLAEASDEGGNGG